MGLCWLVIGGSIAVVFLYGAVRVGQLAGLGDLPLVILVFLVAIGFVFVWAYERVNLYRMLLKMRNRLLRL